MLVPLRVWRRFPLPLLPLLAPPLANRIASRRRGDGMGGRTHQHDSDPKSAALDGVEMAAAPMGGVDSEGGWGWDDGATRLGGGAPASEASKSGVGKYGRAGSPHLQRGVDVWKNDEKLDFYGPEFRPIALF